MHMDKPCPTFTEQDVEKRSQLNLRLIQSKDVQTVRDLFRTAFDTGPNSARRGALHQQRFDAINLCLYAPIFLGTLPLCLAQLSFSVASLFNAFPLVNALGVLLSMIAFAAFAYRKHAVSQAYARFCNESLDEDLADLLGYYQLPESNGPTGFWVAEFDEEVVGCVGLDVSSYNPTNGYLRRMMVSPNHRGLGISKLLLNKVVNHANLYELESLSLSTTAYQIPARRLYEKYGFVEESRSHLGRGLFKVVLVEYTRRL